METKEENVTQEETFSIGLMQTAKRKWYGRFNVSGRTMEKTVEKAEKMKEEVERIIEEGE